MKSCVISKHTQNSSWFLIDVIRGYFCIMYTFNLHKYVFSFFSDSFNISGDLFNKSQTNPNSATITLSIVNL